MVIVIKIIRIFFFVVCRWHVIHVPMKDLCLSNDAVLSMQSCLRKAKIGWNIANQQQQQNIKTMWIQSKFVSKSNQLKQKQNKQQTKLQIISIYWNVELFGIWTNAQFFFFFFASHINAFESAIKRQIKLNTNKQLNDNRDKQDWQQQKQNL